MYQKFIVPINPCPWCHKIPDLYLDYQENKDMDKTWLWKIKCNNSLCSMNPETQPLGIRKTTKNSYERQKQKIFKLCERWNKGLKSLAEEGNLVDLTEILDRK